MSYKDSYDNARFAGPACIHYTLGTSSIYGSVYDRGTTGGNWGQAERYPKGLKANTAGTAVLVSPGGGTCPFVLAAGETLLFRWQKMLATASIAFGTSSIDNFVVIWD